MHDLSPTTYLDSEQQPTLIIHGKADQVENAHFPNQKHGYQFLKRQAMYPFMVKHLKLNSQGVLDPKTGVFDESANTIEDVDDMRVFDDSFPLPKQALKPGTIVKF